MNNIVNACPALCVISCSFVYNYDMPNFLDDRSTWDKSTKWIKNTFQWIVKTVLTFKKRESEY